MGTAQFLKAFRIVLVLSIIMLLVGCGGKKTGKNNAGTIGGEEVPAEALTAKIVTKDILSTTGTNGEPSAYITIKPGESVNFKGDVSGGSPPYTYNWYFDYIVPDVNVKDPGNIAFINVNGSYYGSIYTIEFTVTDKNGNQSVDSLDVIVFHD